MHRLLKSFPATQQSIAGRLQASPSKWESQPRPGPLRPELPCSGRGPPVRSPRRAEYGVSPASEVTEPGVDGNKNSSNLSFGVPNLPLNLLLNLGKTTSGSEPPFSQGQLHGSVCIEPSWWVSAVPTHLLDTFLFTSKESLDNMVTLTKTCFKSFMGINELIVSESGQCSVWPVNPLNVHGNK